MNTKKIEKSVEELVAEYNANNVYYRVNDEVEEHEIEDYPITTGELVKKYNVTFEDCKKVDEQIVTWDNEDVAMTSAYIVEHINELDDKFAKKNIAEIEEAIYQYLTLFEGDNGYWGPQDTAKMIYQKFAKHLDREELIDSLEADGEDREFIERYIC